MDLTLLTGAPGWLGTRFLRTLAGEVPDPRPAGGSLPKRVRCLVLPGAALPSLDGGRPAETVTGDLRDPAAAKTLCRGAEGAVLYHAAGLIHPALLVRDLFEVNVRGTENLLAAAEEAGVRRVVLISSNSPLGANPRRDHLFDEDSPYRPYMSYGRSKMLMEEAARTIQERGRLQTVILRPAWFYGPEQAERQTVFFRMIRSGKAPILGDGGNLRSLTYVDNLCQAMLLAGESPAADGRTYWVADRRPYPMNEIIDTIERLLEEEFNLPAAHRRLRLPSLGGEVAWVADRLIQGVGLYHQKIHVLSEMGRSIACSVERAQRELGYRPAIELEEGMRRSIAWCLSRGIRL